MSSTILTYLQHRLFVFFSSRRRHTRFDCDWSSDVCSSDLVTEVAQFSVRGGILDAYGFGMAAPVRIEWWGDEIVSLRSFDLDSQRSGEQIGRASCRERV